MATSTITKTHLGNIASIELVTATITAGATGNINTDLANDGKTLVFGGYCSGSNSVILPFVSGVNNKWYLKVRNADSMNTVNNTSVAVRYYVLKLA